MSPVELTLAVLALLLTPGPTNSLMLQQNSKTEPIGAAIVADDLEIFRTLPKDCVDQDFGDADEAEPSHRDGNAVGHVGNSFGGTRYDFIHHAADHTELCT